MSVNTLPARESIGLPLAVILVDMQPWFLDRLSLDRLAALMGAQRKILRECSLHDVPVFITECEGRGNTHEEIMSELQTAKQVVTVVKKSTNGFHETTLQKELARHPIRALLFMGVNAAFCVKQTAVAARGFGYQIITARTLITNTCPCRNCSVAEVFEWGGHDGVFFETTPSLNQIAQAISSPLNGS